MSQRRLHGSLAFSSARTHVLPSVCSVCNSDLVGVGVGVGVRVRIGVRIRVRVRVRDLMFHGYVEKTHLYIDQM